MNTPHATISRAYSAENSNHYQITDPHNISGNIDNADGSMHCPPPSKHQPLEPEDLAKQSLLRSQLQRYVDALHNDVREINKRLLSKDEILRQKNLEHRELIELLGTMETHDRDSTHCSCTHQCCLL